MSQIQIKLRNYRTFALANPITYNIHEGITFVLGQNNIGKSNTIRAFFEFRNLTSSAFTNTVNKQESHSEASLEHPFDRYSNRKTPIDPIEIDATIDGNGFRIIIASSDETRTSNRAHALVRQINQPKIEIANQIQSLFSKSLYIGPFRSTDSKLGNRSFDTLIGKSFVSQWNHWANGENIEHAEKIELLTEELREIFDFKRLKIDVSHDNTDLLFTNEDGRFSIQELGGGISHFIISLGNALIKSPDYILIDEPESGLHPKQQEVFIRSLASKAKRGLMATSHSIALARSTADKIYNIAKNEDGTRSCAPFGDNKRTTVSQSIAEMSYSQHAELGSNHLLLVEGRTDIKSFREILRKYKIDQHFIIWSLNGSDWTRARPEDIIDELQELKRLNPKSISIIFDSEKRSEFDSISPELARFESTCKQLGFQTFATEYHSTENYITQEAINRIAPGHVKLAPFEKFGSNGHKKWPKTKNWLMFREMNRDDLDKTELKIFITKQLIPLVRSNQPEQPLQSIEYD